MPKKGYKQIEEHKKKISLTLFGKSLGPKNRHWKLSEITKNKMSLFNKGKHLSTSTRLKVSNSLKKYYMNNKVNDITKNIISSKLKERYLQSLNDGSYKKYNHTLETKEKIHKILSDGRLKGKIFSEEHKNKLKISRKNQILPKKDTSIEIKIQNFLKQLNIEFLTHQHIDIKHQYQCDILIPSMNLVIECDGDYWHKYPIGKDIDKIRTSELINKGFKILRLWEREIKSMNLLDLKNKLGFKE